MHCSQHGSGIAHGRVVIMCASAWGSDSRGEGVVLGGTADALAESVGLVGSIGLIGPSGPIGLVVEVELIETVGEGQKNQTIDEEKLQDVQQHPTQRDLKWTQV